MSGLKLAVAFATGIGCGVLCTYAYFKKENEKKEAEVASYFREKIAELRSEIDEIRGVSKDSGDCKIDKDCKDEEKKERTIYANTASSYISSVPMSENEIIRRMEESHPKDDTAEEQFQITSMDWFEDNIFEKQEVTYYVGDECLVGNSENKDEDILDVGSTIGHEAVDILMSGFDDGSALFIRNPDTGIDYEITKSFSSYKEMSLR